MIKRLWYSLLSNDKPQDKNVIWIDTSNSESFTLKLYRNGDWKPLQVVGTSRDMIERELTGYVTSHYHSYDRIINKPTTLEGYGITDCFNKKEVEKLLDNKVTKVDGMSLTSNNFSNKYKKMLDDLSTSYYNKKNVDNLLNKKQDVISDLKSIREGAKKGNTALQSFTETDPIYLKDKPFIALKSDLLNDNNLVHKEGDEDIKGIKRFEYIRTNNFGIYQGDNNNHSVYIDYHYDESNYLPILHFGSEEDWLTILDNIADPVDDFHAANKHYVDESLTTKQDTLTPGNGISIEGNVISSSVAEVVDNIVNAGYLFAGVATPSTNPGTPEAKVFYIADGKGTYTNFGGIEVTEDEVVILYYDTAWHKEVTGIATQEKLTELEGIVKEINIPFFNRKAYIDLSSAVVGEIYNDKLGSGLYNYAKSECHEGEIFLINTIENTDKAKAYAILDHDNRVLAVERTAVNKEIVIPTGGVSLYVNSKIDALSYIKKKDNAVEDNKEGISELRTDVGISIGCEYGAINYLTGQYINDTNYCRTIQPIPINANSIIKMLFPISVNKAYMIKYKDGVYVGYAEIGKIDTTEYNYRITYDGSYDSFELRFDVKPTAEQLSSVKIIYSQGVFINELGKAIKDIATIKTDIDDLKEKQSDLYDKEYFVDRVNQYVDLNYNVGDYADLTKHEKFSGYGYVIVELYQGESVTANVSGGTVRAKSITVIGRSGIILFNKTYTYNDTYTASEDCLVIFNMRIADGYRIVAHKDKSKMYNQNIYTDVVFNTMLVKRLNLSGYRNIGEFGKIIIDELYSHYLALVPNHNLPHTKDYGFITTDADFVQEFEDSNDELKMMRAKSPCFFYDGKRKGCIVLFDEVGEAYIIDNTGNKKYLSFK